MNREILMRWVDAFLPYQSGGGQQEEGLEMRHQALE